MPPIRFRKVDVYKRQVTSGLRLGTPAATTRGFDADDMDQIAEAITLTLKDFEGNKEKATAIVKSLTDKHPLYE